MKLKPPKRKKIWKIKPPKEPGFPKARDNSSLMHGRFNGFAVVVENPDDIGNIHSHGYFGKGCFSRSFPSVKNQKKPSIIRDRQYKQRKEWTQALKPDEMNEETTIILKDSDSEEDTFFNNLKPDTAKVLSVVEYLHLGLEEAYFLMSAVKCLDVFDENNEQLDKDSAWRLFCDAQENFIQNYVAYYYFRVRNWVVKSGLKFGGDFLLYHLGPEFYHASYAVIIDVLRSDTMERHTNICKKTMNWTYLIGLNRLALTAAKDLVVCQVIWPQDVTIDSIKSKCDLKQFSVNTVLMRRWVASQERTVKD